MPFPLAGLAIGLTALAPSAMNIGSKVQKFYGKYGNTSLGQASQFGLGYGATTNIGYNLSNTYLTSGARGTKDAKGNIVTLSIDDKMSYGYRSRYSYGNRSYGSRNRYGSRKIRVWSKRYRRYIYVNRRY